MAPTYVRLTDRYGYPLYIESAAIYCFYEEGGYLTNEVSTVIKLWGIDGNADVMVVKESADTVAAKLSGLES